jgi:hypothetical protein
MNEDTTYLLGRPYQEVVDDLLTGLIGGVVNEPIHYDVKADLYHLAEPASDVRAVTGLFGQDRHSFLKDVDFAFSEADNAVIWGAGDRPNDDSTFYVDYARKNGRSPLTDINVGSVSRTLGEAISREIATVYKQIDLAYLSGFLATATGRSLDLVVAILGATRKTKEFAVGLVTFFRDTSVSGAIAIPEGTLLATAKGEVRFETTEQRVLQAGQARIDAPVRAADGFAGDPGIVPAGAISAMVLPLAGITRVTNFDPTLRAADDETDEELRARARAALRALGKATLAALDRVIREGRGTPVEFWDPNSPPAQASDPGTVAILVEATPERFTSLRAAVEETRAAGVVTTLVARYVYLRPRLAAQVDPGLTAAGKEKVKAEVIAAFQGYVDGLGSGEPALGSKLLDALDGVVTHPVFKDVLAAKSDIGQPQSSTLLDALVGAAAAAPAGGSAALHDALALVLADTASAAPTGARIPDRNRVQSLAGAGGARASDAEIEAGQFQVSAVVDGDAWWVVLDMSPNDVLLEEG